MHSLLSGTVLAISLLGVVHGAPAHNPLASRSAAPQDTQLLALPPTLDARSLPDAFLAVPQDVNFTQSVCDTPDYHRTTSAGSPLVSDCQDIVGSLNGGYKSPWIVSSGITIANGTCALALQSWPPGLTEMTEIGRLDITNIIHKSIEMFSWTKPDGDVVVGTQGSLDCFNTGPIGENPVNWELRHA
ncbi:hypothetical protein B0T22DRAFT_479077 [Podospora appendiculata]|uniref:Ecp2 effector protein-like domain-containing protein n=1 Tax=Podospora appendiculata TaxID=314037 RepID=A0AAE0X802_9PEZI|nr:hypothetical protein B0T22DRAFT_479077 [Podospora appendiculata]